MSDLAAELRLFHHNRAADHIEALEARVRELGLELAVAWEEGATFGGLYDRVYPNDNPYRSA